MQKKNSFTKFITHLQKNLDKKSLDFLNEKISFKKKGKKKYDVVTKLDLKIEKYIRSEIKKNFKNHDIIGEELNNVNKRFPYKWFIDPIDGTKNMIMGMPSWSNMIGLFYDKKALCSLINFPVLKKYYFTKNYRSYVVKNNKPRIINSGTVENIKNAKIVLNTLHTLKKRKAMSFIKNFKGFFKITGADSLNFCLLAEGKIDVVLESGLKIVDIMPVVALIENSGGVISDWSGNKNFSSGKILACGNRVLHNKILNKINS